MSALRAGKQARRGAEMSAPREHIHRSQRRWPTGRVSRMLRSRRRMTALGVGVALVGGILAACSSGKTSSNPSQGGGAPVRKSGTITIAYLQKQGDQQYFVDEANGAKKEAATLGGVKVDVVDLGTDSNKAISAMSTEVGQQVDGIAIVVPDQKIGPQVIDAAHGANIPIVASDDPIQGGDGDAAAFVGFDSVQMAPRSGRRPPPSSRRPAGRRPTRRFSL